MLNPIFVRVSKQAWRAQRGPKECGTRLNGTCRLAHLLTNYGHFVFHLEPRFANLV